MAPRTRSAAGHAFDALPSPLLRYIMLALPAEARARCACVCRAWRSLLADATMWQRLELPAFNDETVERLMRTLRGVAERAAGQLRALKIDYDSHRLGGLRDEINAVIAANAASLRERALD